MLSHKKKVERRHRLLHKFTKCT
jgi:hypothetical protein